MSETTFPRVRRVQVGYSPVEDRLQLHLALAGEQGVAVCWVPRRVLMQLAGLLNEALRRSHPATEGEPAADAVMALEHQAARSELAGQRQAPDDADAAASAEPEAEAESGADGMTTAYLVTEVRLDVPAGDQVRLGVLGHPLPTGEGLHTAAEAIAGLVLSRTQAHELLRMLAEQARQADWGLPRRLGWLARLARGVGQG